MTNRHRPFLLLLVVAGSLMLALTACTAARRINSAYRSWKSATLRVTISNLPPADVNAYVLIFTGDPTHPTLFSCEVIPDSGNYSAKVPYETDLQVVAFVDSNGDRRWEPGEPVDRVEHVKLVFEEHEVKLSLRAGGSIPASLQLEVPSGVWRQEISPRSPGEVVTLDDPRLSAETGRTGLLHTREFLRAYGETIFFLQAYDPQKIPVLFIYGISGSPQDWRYIIEHLDRKCFQPWLFHYPTGDRLSDRARELNSQVKQLQNRFRFKKLFVVGHSMGGLVARDFILRNTFDDHQTYIEKLITISSPWGGHKGASLPVPNLPIVTILAVQNDIAPQSEFLVSLFARRLPPAVTFYLIYGVASGIRQNALRPLLGENDGVVGEDSVLAPAAKAEAHKVIGLNYEHTAILSAPETLSKLHEFLME
ncbi:MAG: alpha/beta fold hydrolase [Chloroflexi bacterium]|nr:alpha/beta fold hydrolase [Chloroflexota bacterium]